MIGKFEDSLQPYCLENARGIFSSALDRFQRSATRYQTQLQFERNLASKSKDELARYIIDPAATITAQFDAEWRHEEAKVLEQAQQIYVTEGNSLQPLERWVLEVYRQIESAKFTTANDIFLAPSGLGAVEALLNKEKAVVLLYCDLLRGKMRNTRYTVDGQELEVVDWNVASSSDGAKNIEKLDLLVKLVASVETISDLLTFAQRLAARVSNVGNAMRRHLCTTIQLDPSNRLQLARERAAGCNQLCPCCKRCCDEEHWRIHNLIGTGPNRHKCRLGHQYRGMAGYAFEKTKFASLKMCGDMLDDERVWFNDRYVIWSDFRAKFPSWDFHYAPYVEKGLDSTRNRMAFIWGQVGQELCNEYPFFYKKKKAQKKKSKKEKISKKKLE